MGPRGGGGGGGHREDGGPSLDLHLQPPLHPGGDFTQSHLIKFLLPACRAASNVPWKFLNRNPCLLTHVPTTKVMEKYPLNDFRVGVLTRLQVSNPFKPVQSPHWVN